MTPHDTLATVRRLLTELEQRMAPPPPAESPVAANVLVGVVPSHDDTTDKLVEALAYTRSEIPTVESLAASLDQMSYRLNHLESRLNVLRRALPTPLDTQPPEVPAPKEELDWRLGGRGEQEEPGIPPVEHSPPPVPMPRTSTATTEKQYGRPLFDVMEAFVAACLRAYPDIDGEVLSRLAYRLMRDLSAEGVSSLAECRACDLNRIPAISNATLEAQEKGGPGRDTYAHPFIPLTCPACAHMWNVTTSDMALSGVFRDCPACGAPFGLSILERGALKTSAPRAPAPEAPAPPFSPMETPP